MSLVDILTGIKMALEEIAPALSIILIVSGGIVYGIAQTQPAELRGKWQSFALGLFVGGIIIGAIAGGAQLIRDKSLQIIGPGPSIGNGTL